MQTQQVWIAKKKKTQPEKMLPSGDTREGTCVKLWLPMCSACAGPGQSCLPLSGMHWLVDQNRGWHVHPALQHFGPVRPELHRSYSFPHNLDVVLERPARFTLWDAGDQLAGAEGMLALPACGMIPDA
mmetsp:Transcript_55202/g.109691  ORF Transcript_55202/g.109691 Transcript_55202/m.109691 type:complete len:128 (+) Transcript_55202:328-711(+)